MGGDRVLSHRGGWGPGVTGRRCREGEAWLVVNRATVAKEAVANLLVSLHLLKMTFSLHPASKICPIIIGPQ